MIHLGTIPIQHNDPKEGTVSDTPIHSQLSDFLAFVEGVLRENENLRTELAERGDEVLDLTNDGAVTDFVNDYVMSHWTDDDLVNSLQDQERVVYDIVSGGYISAEDLIDALGDDDSFVDALENRGSLRDSEETEDMRAAISDVYSTLSSIGSVDLEDVLDVLSSAAETLYRYA